MKDFIVKFRNFLSSSFYRLIVKRILFKLPPEFVHDRFTLFGRLLGSNVVTRAFSSLFFSYSNPILKQKILGIDFKNPVGLSAGFDKNAKLIDILPSIGFGFEEIGSITGMPCEGNPKPRLWRHAESQSLRVYYGLKNEGSYKIAKRLKEKKFRFPVGVSIAKTNCKETVEISSAIQDYVNAYNNMLGIGAYVTINISCPNAFGGQPFTNPDDLDRLLSEIIPLKDSRPILIKLSPDLSKRKLESIVQVAKTHKIDGLICSNLTKKHKYGLGGLSGKAVERKSSKQLRYLFKHYSRDFILIGVGGIFSAEDAYNRIKDGASLVQMITGMIFKGPQVISEINLGIVELLKKDGYHSITEAIGVNIKK